MPCSNNCSDSDLEVSLAITRVVVGVVIVACALAVFEVAVTIEVRVVAKHLSCQRNYRSRRRASSGRPAKMWGQWPKQA